MRAVTAIAAVSVRGSGRMQSAGFADGVALCIMAHVVSREAARGCSSMVEPQSSKLITRVRFPSSAPLKRLISNDFSRFHLCRNGTTGEYRHNRSFCVDCDLADAVWVVDDR